MAGYIGTKASVVSSGAERKKVFDITTTTTSLTGCSYTPNQVHVFHNGVRLVDGTDYTATDGSTVTLTTAAQNGDEVVVISYATFQTSDTVSASAGGTFSNAVTVNGNFSVDTDTLFVDAANNSVGVGTSSPSTYGLFSAVGSTNGFQSVSFVNTSNGASAVNRIQVGNDASAGAGQIVVYGSQHSTLANVMDVNNATSAALRLLTNNTERARIDASGNLLVGKTVTTFTTNGLWLQPNGTYWAGRTSDVSLVLNRNGTDGDVAQFYKGGTIVGAIAVTASSTAYYTSSDYRLKENVVPLAGAADRLAQIPVHRFNFIADPNTVVDGFLAHEVQAFVPEAVTGEKDAVDNDGKPVHQGIDQSKLVPLLTAALQEALQKIEALEARITALEA